MTDVLLRQQQERQRIIAKQQAAQATGTQPQQDLTAQQQQQADDFLKRYVQLDNGEYVERDKYNSLDTESQSILKSKGVDAYNTYKAQQYEAEFAKTNIKLSDGNWVTKESYNSLPAEWQSNLYNKGIEGYKSWWDSKPYGNSTAYYVMDGRVYVPSDNPNIGIDASGMRVWLGERWPEHAIRYSGKPTDVTTATLIAQGKTMVPAEVTLPSLYKQPSQNERTYGSGFLAEHTQLSNGEWITTQTLNNLDAKTRESILKYGSSAKVDDTYAIKQIKESTGYANEIKNNPNYVYEEDAIKLKSGDLIDATAYKGLSSDLKNALDKGGFAEYEKVLAKDYVKLPDDTYMKKEDYNNLSFTQKQIADSKGYDGLRELELEGDAVINTLNRDFSTPDGFDIFGYLSKTGDIKGLVAAGFANKDISDAVTKISQQPSIKAIKSTVDNINDMWQALTPWQEENDQNFIDYVIGLYKDAEETKAGLTAEKGSKEWNDVQNKLKNIYEEEENSPWWWKIIFGKSVIQDIDGNYTILQKFQSPDISPLGSSAGRAAELSRIAKQMKPYVKGTVTISAKEVGMNEPQFARWIRYRVGNPDSKLSPQSWKNWDDIMQRGILTVKNKLPENIAQPNIKRAIKSTGSHLSGKHGPAQVNKELSDYTKRLLQEKGLIKTSVIEQIEKIPEKQLTSDQKLVKQAHDIYVKANESVQKVIESTSYGTANIQKVDTAIVNAVNRGVATESIAKNTKAVSTAYAMASPHIKELLIKNLDAKTGNSIAKGNIAQAKANAIAELHAQTKLKTIALAASKLAEKLQNEGKTVAEVQSELKQFAQAKSESLPSNLTKADVKAMIQPIIQNITQPVPQPKVKVQPGYRQLVKPKIDTTKKQQQKKDTQPKKGKRKERDDDGKRKIPPPPVFWLKGGKEQKGITESQKKGLVAWKQGFMYVAIYPPYEEPQTLYSRDPIEGVKYYDDVGSAARSLIAKGGKIPEHIYKDMGIVDITITRTRNEAKPEITYRLDRMQRTTYSSKNKTAGIKAVR